MRPQNISHKMHTQKKIMKPTTWKHAMKITEESYEKKKSEKRQGSNQKKKTKQKTTTTRKIAEFYRFIYSRLLIFHVVFISVLPAFFLSHSVSKSWYAHITIIYINFLLSYKLL